MAKAQRFTFDDKCKMVLVRSTDLSETHLANYSNVSANLSGLRAMFMASHELMERIKKRGCDPPTWLTSQERFKRLVTRRRAYVKKVEAESGASEEYGEFESILDA